MAWSATARANDDVVEIARELYSTSDEHPTPIEAHVSGEIPEWFEGTLLRVGPGKCNTFTFARIYRNGTTLEVPPVSNMPENRVSFKYAN